MQVVIDVVGEAPQPTEQVLAVAKRLLVVLTKGCLKAPVECEVLGEEPHLLPAHDTTRLVVGACANHCS